MPHWIGERRPAGGGTCLPITLNSVPDVALGRVGDEPDLAARPGDPGELGCGSLLVRREHRAEDGADHVEAVVVERDRLGVAVLELRLHAFGDGAPRARSSSDGT